MNDLHDRRSIRLQGYDYSQAGAYFVTICSHNREYLFGEIVGGQMHLNVYGTIVQNTWDDLVNHVAGIKLGEFVIMPNHVHGIIIIHDVGAGSNPIRIKLRRKKKRHSMLLRRRNHKEGTLCQTKSITQMQTKFRNY